MRIYTYLRASTKEQDASRAKNALEQFVSDNGQIVSTWFTENESGATLKRPELFRLLDVAQRGDVLLVEQVDRISRLNSTDWELLKSTISNKGIRIVALDLPTSHQFMMVGDDEFVQRMLSAVNAMLLDMLAAVARKDYEDRRRRQNEGIIKAQSAGRYKGRLVNQRSHDNIAALLEAGKSYSTIVNMLGCSRSTISNVSKKMKTP
jgi:DNA invertase Pin-like site-specific DNA recombinase